MKVKSIKARIIKNSKEENTIEITINKKFTASAPSGTSVGKYEKAAFPKKIPIDFVNTHLLKILKHFEFFTFDDLSLIENSLREADGTENWNRLGANTVIAVEYAILKAMSNNKIWKFLNPNAYKMPMPLGNVIGGGAHFKGKNVEDIQEFLLLPQTRSFHDAAFANSYVYNLIGKKLSINRKTSEKAWAPNMKIDETLNLLKEATEKVSDELGFKILIGMDIAATQLFWKNYYLYAKEEKKLDREQQIGFVASLIKRYNLAYAEDPLEQDDFNGFSRLRKNNNALICGDDLICTNIERLEKAIKEKAINAVIIKPNQIGSLIETKEVINLAKENGIIPIISHRSGETMDNTIAHLAVGFEIPIIKCGIKGKEREAKINELIRIEKEL